MHNLNNDLYTIINLNKIKTIYIKNNVLRYITNEVGELFD